MTATYTHPSCPNRPCRPHGPGEIVFPDGAKYTGLFRAGRQHLGVGWAVDGPGEEVVTGVSLRREGLAASREVSESGGHL